MKKVLVLVVAAMMATMSATAQQRYEDNRHEVAVSYGIMSNSQWLNSVIMTMNIFEGLTPVKGSAFGPISAEYFYHANSWLGVGAIFSFGQVTTQYNLAIDNDTEVYTGKNTSYTLMPAVKFNWFRRQHFGMYSKVGAGVMMCNMKAIPADPFEKTDSETGFGFNWQVSALGIEFGGTQFRGFVEGGFGEQGIAVAGLRYMF